MPGKDLHKINVPLNPKPRWCNCSATLSMFSRMRSRRVPVLKVGVQGSNRRPAIVVKAFAKRSQPFASVRKRSQASAKRSQSVRKASACVARVCRAVKLRGNSKGRAPRCRLRSTFHASRLHSAGVSRRQAKGELHRACVEATQGTPQGTRPGSTGHAPRCRSRGCVAQSS